MRTGSKRRSSRVGKEVKVREDEEEEGGDGFEDPRFMVLGLIVSSSLVAASRGRRPWCWQRSVVTAAAVECPRRVCRKIRKIVFGLSLLSFDQFQSDFFWGFYGASEPVGRLK